MKMVRAVPFAAFDIKSSTEILNDWRNKTGRLLAMECSVPTPISRGLAVESPTLNMVAVANGNVLEVHNLNTTTLRHSITTADSISHIVWGTCAEKKSLVAAASTPSHCVVVVDPEDGRVIADVHASPLVIASISLRFGYLLQTAEHGVALSIVSVLRARETAQIPFVKLRAGGRAHVAWSGCGRYVGVITRRDGVDGIVIVSAGTGQVRLSLRDGKGVGGLSSLAGLRWLPCNRLLVWGGGRVVRGGGMALISLDGKVVRTKLKRWEETDGVGLGIRGVAVSSCGRLVAMGGYDGVIRLVDVANWGVIKPFSLVTPEVSETEPPTVFREMETESGKGTFFEVVQGGLIEIGKRIRTAAKSGVNAFGVCSVDFSACGAFLAARSAHAANVVLIWEVKKLRLAAMLVLQTDVSCMRWSGGSAPLGLAVCCAGDSVYLWRRGGAAAVMVSGGAWRAPFYARKLAWAADDSALLVVDAISAKAFRTVFIAPSNLV